MHPLFFEGPSASDTYTLSLHDALPICRQLAEIVARFDLAGSIRPFTRCMRCNGVLIPIGREEAAALDRKSTRLNSSHMSISYAVFCLKKKRIDSKIPGRY